MPPRRRRLRHGFTKSELLILVAVGFLTVTGLSLRAALGLGKAAATPRVGSEVSAGLQATIAKAASTRSKASSTTATTAPAAKSPPSTSRPVPPADVKWVNTNHQIAYQGMTRSYMVAEPTPPPTGKVPVIVVLHGVNSNPLAEEARTGFPPIVGPAILVYPAGYLNTWDAGTCCGAPVGMHLDDVGFVKAVTQQVLATYPQASSSQVFLVGYSLGGKLAWDIACHGAGPYRAVATYGSVPVTSCPQVGPVAAMIMAGTDDPQIVTSMSEPQISVAGFTEDRIPTFVAQVRTDDSCGDASSTEHLGGETTQVWAHCAPGDVVASTLYAGQDHGWPEGTSSTPSAQQVIWAFFRSLGAT
ncbi:MAG TPA: dienelactone hydrolase family protein [Acidimicrobiales bacterium]|nr:dienelactone hydrolase family protein [Acidimicrobiales bacterium]